MWKIRVASRIVVGPRPWLLVLACVAVVVVEEKEVEEKKEEEEKMVEEEEEEALLYSTEERCTSCPSSAQPPKHSAVPAEAHHWPHVTSRIGKPTLCHCYQHVTNMFGFGDCTNVIMATNSPQGALVSLDLIFSFSLKFQSGIQLCLGKRKLPLQS